MEDTTEPGIGRLMFWPDMDLLSSDRLTWMATTNELDPLLSNAIRSAVANDLSQRQREVVEGYFFEGISQPQLAKKLGISQQVIHKCLYGTKRNGRMVGGALRKLRTILTPLVL